MMLQKLSRSIPSNAPRPASCAQLGPHNCGRGRAVTVPRAGDSNGTVAGGSSLMGMKMSYVSPPAPPPPAPLSTEGGPLATGPAKPFELHVNETTISIPFSKERAKAFAGSFNALLQTFVEKQKAEKPKRWSIMEFSYKGDTDLGELELFEIACNPNAYPTAFDAKMLITIKTKDGVKVMTEARLSNVKSDLGAYLS